MTDIVAYDLIGYTDPHHFTIGGKDFVYVHLIVESPEGEVKEMNFQTFTADKWEHIKETQVVCMKENVPQNIMVGDYYS